LERQPALAEALERANERVGDAQQRVQTLLDKVKGLDFETSQLTLTKTRWQEAVAAAERASRSAQVARLDAERERARAEAQTARLSEGEAQHAKLADLSAEATHLSRAAELLNAFRNTVVALVGPRLAVQAAELFGELTDNEYDQLEVDPETYELQVRDAGRLYGMDRFSGSEIDLANLALRVAISEHVRFQSGGSVGLLVLDEVFGPLDEDRKARMLLALERLRGRFRQILVVTHDVDIKEQLPSAIEVIKKPGRRATARLVEAS
jgi:exonuclease SbcC